MKTRCQINFLKHLQQIQQLPQNEQCNGAVLVLDQTTSKLISPLITLDSIFDYGIRSLGSVSVKRKPQLDASGIYFISCQSIQHVIKDFKKQPTYFSINLLFCQSISKQVMEQISKEEQVIGRVASFAQLYLNSIYISENISLLSNHRHLMNNVFTNDLQTARQLGTELLISLISGFGSHIYLDVHFWANSNFCSAIVKQLQKETNDHLQSLKADRMGKNHKLTQRQRLLEMEMSQDMDFYNQEEFTVLKVIVADRKYDPLSPAVHNFYYLPMLVDLLAIETDNSPFEKPKITIKNKEEISINLTGDKVLQRYKNAHINQAFKNINEDFVKFTQENKAAQFQKNQQKELSAKDMQSVLQAIPEYQKTWKSYQQHIDIMHELSNLNKSENLSEFGDLEHLIVSKLTVQGKQMKDKKILPKILSILDSIKNPKTKARMIYIVICGVELLDSDRSSLLKRLAAIQGYKELSDRVSQFVSKVPTRLPLNIDNKKSIFLDRHQTKVAELFRSVLTGKQDKDIKNIKLGKGEQPKSPTRFKKIAKTGQHQTKEQWVLFMPGGVSYNEISNIQRIFQLKEGKELNIITDQVYSPSSFLSAFSQMKRN